MQREVRLLIGVEPPAEEVIATRVGGRPLMPSGATWPLCRSCGDELQFHAQVLLDDRSLLLLFMCSSPGNPDAPKACGTFHPSYGASHAIVVPTTELALLTSASNRSLLRFSAGASIEHVPAEHDPEDPEGVAYDLARVARPDPRNVLGQLGGVYDGLLDPPQCACGAPMKYAVQLEQGPDAATEMNFAGGCLYAFRCERCPGSAALCWG